MAYCKSWSMRMTLAKLCRSGQLPKQSFCCCRPLQWMRMLRWRANWPRLAPRAAAPSRPGPCWPALGTRPTGKCPWNLFLRPSLWVKILWYPLGQVRTDAIADPSLLCQPLHCQPLPCQPLPHLVTFCPVVPCLPCRCCSYSAQPCSDLPCPSVCQFFLCPAHMCFCIAPDWHCPCFSVLSLMQYCLAFVPSAARRRSLTSWPISKSSLSHVRQFLCSAALE